VSKPKTILVWFKSDLRLADNETWFRASQDGDFVIPVFIFDQRQFQQHPLGFNRVGSFRAQFLLESVLALKQNLASQGSDLIVRIGEPEFIINQIASDYKVSAVYTAREVTFDEVSLMSKTERGLNQLSVPLKQFWTSTMIHDEDIPWPIQRLPDMFTQFRKEVESESTVRAVFPIPGAKPLPEIDPGLIPAMEELGLTKIDKDDRSVIDYRGGEESALQRWNEYVWKKICSSTISRHATDL
jgi:deoxyribodipyrimidine photo-lyase